MQERYEIGQESFTPDYRIVDSFHNTTHEPQQDLIQFPNQKIDQTKYSQSEAYLEVVRSGMKTGENIHLFTGPDDNPHIGTILYSEMYNLKCNGVGEITGYFLQYEQGYRGSDGFGIIHPGSVPHRRTYTNDRGELKQDNTARSVGYSGNETLRVLTVKYNPIDQQIQREYIKGKDLRYALDDKRRLDETRNRIRSIKESAGNQHNSTDFENDVKQIDWDFSNDLPFVAD